MKLVHICFTSLLVTVVLTGCETFPAINPPCMKSAVVPNLSKTAVYPILDDDPRAVTLNLVKTSCEVAKEEMTSEKSNIILDLTLSIPKARKTSKREKEASFPVFVALLDSEDDVLDRHDETINMLVNDKGRIHSFKIKYDLPQGVDVSSSKHRLLIGFQGGIRVAHIQSKHKKK